jgi:hypothetical protein
MKIFWAKNLKNANENKQIRLILQRFPVKFSPLSSNAQKIGKNYKLFFLSNKNIRFTTNESGKGSDSPY